MRRRSSSLTLGVSRWLAWVLLLLCAAGPAAAAGLEAAVWPMLGGALAHPATSTFLGPATNTLAWSFQANSSIDGGAAIDSDGSLYFGSANGRFYAVEQNGQLRWSQKNLPPVVGVPLLAQDGKVYVGVNSGSIATLYAFDRVSGVGGPIFGAASPLTGSPAMDRSGTILLATRGKGIFAVSANGALLWRSDVGKLERSAPAVGPDGAIYVGTADGRLVALEPTGALRWQRALASKTTILASPTLGADGRIYVGAEDRRVRAVAATGTLLWTFTAGGAVRAGVALGHDGALTFGADDRKVYRLRETGQLVWTALLGGALRSTPVVDREGGTYIGAEDMRVYALEADGQQRWSFQTGAAVRSALAIGVGGRLFVGSNDKRLYALGEFRAGKECWSDAFLDSEGLSEREANKRLQVLLAACGGPDVDSCSAAVYGCVNADRTAAAFQVASKDIDPSTYLGLLRDRARKLRALRAGAGVGLCEVAAGDADGDLIPDGRDQCPDTPPLTATFDDGCTDPSRPDAGDPDLFYAFVNASGFLFDRHCSGQVPGAPVPARIDAFGSSEIFQRHLVFLPDESPDPECGAFYEVEIVHRAADGTFDTFYIVGPRTFGDKGCAIGSITPGLRQFCMAASDPGPQGAFARLDVGPEPAPGVGQRLGPESGIVGYRMRATSYDGRHSPWSLLVIPGSEECLPAQCP